MPTPSLPVELAKGDNTRTASTPAEYYDLVFKGFKTVEPGAETEEDPSPQEKAARTRAANKAKEDEKTASGAVDSNPEKQAGNANQS